MIAVDWGGSNLRAYRLDDHGRVLGQRRGEVGALACDGQHAQTLAGVIGDWDDPLVLLCGMVGARGGWIEVPYVPCPAGIATLAAGMVELGTHAGDALRGRRLWCVPGMADHRGAAADVMRGEETQVAGLLAQLGPGRHDVCLPGTHSKWVRVEDGAITGISTALTGELYGLQVLRADIEDNHTNTTRFIKLERQRRDPDPQLGNSLTAIMFRVRSVPAALYKALGGFATNGVNVVKAPSC